MRKVRLNQILFFLIFTAIFALSSAYIAEYVFGYKPCNLCLYERKIFFIIIAISSFALAFFNTKKPLKITIFLSLILLLANALVAVYHVGVEQKIFKISAGCVNVIEENFDSIIDLKKALMEAPSARCDEPSFFFLGLSMAAWNIIYCAALIIISCLFYLRSMHSEIGVKALDGIKNHHS